MKKTFLLVLVLAAMTAAAIVFLVKGKGTTSTPGSTAELAPADTTVYVEAPDLDRTITRWKASSLYQISQEPEWKAFTAKAGDFINDNLPDKSMREVFELLKEADPASAFLAIPSPTSREPNFVGGISYRGKKTSVKGALEKVRELILRGAPAPKSELTNVEGTEVEVLSGPGLSMAFAYRDNWFLFASGLDPMKSLLQRYAGSAGATPSLAKNATFIESVKQAEAEPDFVWYVNTKTLADAYKADRAQMLKGAGAPPEKPAPLEAFMPESVSYSLKFDGPLVRDRMYVRIPKFPKATALGHHLLGVTSANSFAYGVFNAGGLDPFMRPLFATFDEDEIKDQKTAKMLQEKGLKHADVPSVFGPETAFYSDWPAGAEWPSFFFATEVRDAEKGRIFAEAWMQFLRSPSDTSPPVQEGNTTFWSLWGGFHDGLPGVVAYDSKHLVFALNRAQAAEGLKHLQEGGANLGQSDAFKGAMKTIVRPTAGVLYVDIKQPVERLFEHYADSLKTQLAGTPEAAKYFDMTKFPTVQTLTKHLQPSIIAYGDAPEGFVVDASGTIPFSGMLFPTGIAFFGVRAAPMPIPPSPVAAPPGNAPAATLEPAAPATPK